MFGGGGMNGGGTSTESKQQGGAFDNGAAFGGGEFNIPGVGSTRHVYPQPDGSTLEIREVWAANLDTEFAIIRELVEKYPYVAMDTEFPGVVARPVGDVGSQDYQYKTLKCNVDLLKIIQLGLSFCDEKGQLPPGCPTWQFNFSFSLGEDIYAEDSIELLKNSGIDFDKHERHGIDVFRFGELMMTSGLVLLDNVRWISFHSGYDFGYLLKLLTCTALPPDETQFFDAMRTYFPNFYDIKYLITACQNLHGGLQKIAEELKVERVGPMHQAGSDSLLTAQTFFKLCEVSWKGVSNLDDAKFRGELFGLGHNHTVFRPMAMQQQPPPPGQDYPQPGGGLRGPKNLMNGLLNRTNQGVPMLSSPALSASGAVNTPPTPSSTTTPSATTPAQPPQQPPAPPSLVLSPPQGPSAPASAMTPGSAATAVAQQEEAALQYLLPDQYSANGDEPPPQPPTTGPLFP